MSVQSIYDRLLAAVALEGDDAAIRFTTVLQPTGGPGTRIMPPTYPGGYVTAERQLDGGPRHTVKLDEYQSQANRVEEALLDARDAGRIRLPLFEMHVDAAPWSIRLTSLDFPHRYADAYLRDSTINGVRFDKTEIGQAFRIAETGDASKLLQYDPVSLILGAWNSQRQGRQPKFARCYRSEVIGIDYRNDQRKGGRLDPLNLVGTIDDKSKREGDWKFISAGEKKKGGKLSEIGHGNALAGDNAPGGVTIAEARRLGALAFAGLARLKFGGADHAATKAARAALAALALAGDRLAFGAPGWSFRSGCELTVVEDQVAWELRGNTLEPWVITASEAIELFHHAAERSAASGLPISTETITIEPIDSLRAAIEHALTSTEAGDAG